MINYDKEVIKVLKISEKEAVLLKHNYIGTEHLLLGILKSNNKIKNILNNHQITYNQIINEIKKIKVIKTNNQLLYTPLLKRIILSSIDNNKIELKNIICKLIENGEGIAISILNSLNIDLKKLYNEIYNNQKITYGINMNLEVEKEYEKLTGRENELNEIIEVLSRKNKNNPILIGKAGVGKTAIIEELAHKINIKDVPSNLYNKIIISVNMSELISGTRYRGEFEEKLNNLIKEFESNNNLILFIDEIHTIIGAGGAEGAIDASNILKPYLARNKIKCIGATTIEEYNNIFMKDKALNRRFFKIEIKEPNIKETINILNNSKKYYEKFHNVHINKNQIKKIVNYSNKYIKDKYEPDKSLDILDKICTKAKLLNQKKNNLNVNNLLLTLEKEKSDYIKQKDFLNAKLINKKMDKLKNKNYKIVIKDDLIESCFNKKMDKLVGFKTS